MSSNNKIISAETFWNLFLSLCVFSGIAGIVWTMNAWRTGQNLPTTLVDLGPFLLVLVTLINIGLSGYGFLEARKERRLTRATLTESQKDGILETIVQTSEELKDELQKDESYLRTDNTDDNIYPLLGNFERVNDALLRDISPYYEDIYDHLDKYEKLRSSYTERRKELLYRVSEKIPGELDEDILDELLQATGSSLGDVGPNIENDTFYTRLEEYSDELAHISLTLETPNQSVFGDYTSTTWIEQNSEKLIDISKQLRSHESFEDDFEELEKELTEIIELNEKIQNNLTMARFMLKTKYNIQEAEIRRRKKR